MLSAVIHHCPQRDRDTTQSQNHTNKKTFEMHFRALLASAALMLNSAAAQSSATPTTPSTASNTTDLLSLVSQLPTCALGCLEDAATDINCTASDLSCLCSQSSELVSAIGPCLLLSSKCSSNDTNRASLPFSL